MIRVPALRSLQVGGLSRPAASLSTASETYFKPLEVQDGVAIIRIDCPGKMNTISSEMRMAAETMWTNEIANRDDIKAAVFISAKPDNFIAGADINMLKQFKKEGKEDELKTVCMAGHATFDRIRTKNIPLVAAIHGSCLGGGLEWALKCDYRVASSSPKTKLGLPEVKLGLLPGWGGTQALPQLIGLTNALPLIMMGKEVRADKAKKLGLVDVVCDLPSLEQLAIDCAKGLAAGTLKKGTKKKGLMRMATEDFPPGRSYVFKKAKEQADKASGGKYPAIYHILDCIAHGFEGGTQQSRFEFEAGKFVECAKTNESTALIGLFDGMTALKKSRFGEPERSVKKMAVLGAGLMGAGIAQVSAEKGLEVLLKDQNLAGLSKGEDYIRGNWEKKLKRRSMTSHKFNDALSRVVPLHDGLSDSWARHAADCDLVVEAVFEDLALKHTVLKATEAVLPPHAIFASNTSAIPIAKIAEGSSRPGRVIGMHYFSPVPSMPLLEIIPHAGTDDAVVAAAVAVGVKQGKTCIVVKDVPGFYVNRSLSPMLAEIFPLFQDGVTPEQLDKAMVKLGMPVGPVTLLDEVGMDVAAHVTQTMVDDPTMGKRLAGADVSMQQAVMDKGWIGRKTGIGFFVYEGKKKTPNAEAAKHIAEHVKQRDLKLSDEEIQDRMLARFVNETATCLQEDIIASPVDGDIGAVFGVGFLPYTGGPFRMVDSYGARAYVEKMERLADKYGEHYSPCQLLKDHAAADKKFHS